MIVTFNQRDFPTGVLASYGVKSQHLDEFVENLLDLDAAAVQHQRAQLKNPPTDVDHYLEFLLRQRLVQATKTLATYRAILATPVDRALP